MKSLLTIALIASFTGLAVFGFAIINHEAMGGCLFMFGETTLCDTTPLIHISAWQAATRAILAMGLAFILLFLLLALDGPHQLFEPPDFLRRRLGQWPEPRETLFSSRILASVISPRAP
ncbi:MAG: hypothetical protein HYT48_00705 [Candidatus Vogelbacteria bacterium]|nr:hypothetical protein [Candidatus Vogelbacteria bacterium]